MANPTIPWQLLQLDPDTDAPKLMQNFETLQDFLLVEMIHRHHVQAISFDIPAVAAAGEVSVAGLTWLSPFPTGVVPFVWAFANSPSALGAGQTWLIFSAFNVNNTGCDMRIYNSRAAGGAGPIAGGGRALAIDMTFDVSL